ncbi:MAG TPA: hypothetical protein VGZ22_23550 [Isosphaeraceae bacterium]|jgi:hypothetical protein|nr:hypothetical protein [Isosphaeraceae bacterium]
MSGSARVTSIDTIKEFRASLCRFGEDVKNGLGAVEMEVRRMLDWVLHERPLYWQAEIKRRKEQLSDAEGQLFKKKLQARPGSAVHDSEQKENVRIAKRRLMEAEDKLERTKKWGPAFQHAVFEYQARARPTGDMLESDLKHALELLDRMAAALDSYVALEVPSMPAVETAVSTAADEDTVTSSVESKSMAMPVQGEQPGSQTSSSVTSSKAEATDVASKEPAATREEKAAEPS